MTKTKDMVFILDERQETIGIASNGSPFSLPYYNDLHMDTLAGVSTYSFTVPATHPEATKLRINGHIIRQIYDGSYVLFTIKELITGHNSAMPEIEVFAENTAISELLASVKRPSEHTSITLDSILEIVLAEAYGWKKGQVEVEDSRDIAFEDYMTTLEALRHIETTFNVEIYFSVELIGNSIRNKKVNVVEKRGQDNGVRFEYGYNLNGVTRTEDSSGIITALIAVGKGDNSKTRLDLKKLEVFNDGNFFKNAGTDWIGSEDALQQWSKDGKHIFGFFVDDDADTVQRLKRVAIRELEKRIVPSVHYSVQGQRLEELTGYESKKLSVGDTIIALDRTFTPPIAITGRVQGLEISYTDSTASKFDLGNYKPLALKTPAEITRLQNVISLKEQEWRDTGTTCVIESLGGDVFRNDSGSTVLTARVYKGSSEVDLNGSKYLYKWYKYNSGGTLIEKWGGTVDYRTGKQLAVSNIDVDEKATFMVKIDELI